MVDDLVKRLRSPEVFLMTSGMINPVAEAAASRIDKLEAALREIINKDSFSMDWAIRTARKALEKKDALDR